MPKKKTLQTKHTYAMLCLPDHEQVQNISVEFLWICILFSTTTQMQSLNARLNIFRAKRSTRTCILSDFKNASLYPKDISHC